MKTFETAISLVPSVSQKPFNNSTQPVLTFLNHSAMGNGPMHDMTLLCIMVRIKYALHKDDRHEVSNASSEAPNLYPQRGCVLLLSCRAGQLTENVLKTDI